MRNEGNGAGVSSYRLRVELVAEKRVKFRLGKNLHYTPDRHLCILIALFIRFAFSIFLYAAENRGGAA